MALSLPAPLMPTTAYAMLRSCSAHANHRLKRIRAPSYALTNPHNVFWPDVGFSTFCNSSPIPMQQTPTLPQSLHLTPLHSLSKIL
jgi:hypothetical protein